ncbi:MAG: hypothetical protein V3V67_01990 [Myxococcota bacterium]
MQDAAGKAAVITGAASGIGRGMAESFAAPSMKVVLRRKKRVFSTHITESLLEEARNCVVALSGPPHHLTLSALVERALRRELTYLKRTKNAGRPFARRAREVRTGRPIGS